MARQLESEVEVQASPERVWEVLTDFAAYPDWNPFIVQAGGRAAPGSRFGHLLVLGLFEGEHRFTIEPAGPGRARVTQRETFRGLLAPLLLAFIAGPTLEGFRRMNRALQARPRSRPPPRRPRDRGDVDAGQGGDGRGPAAAGGGGTAALTMRRLAERLGIRAPSLYKHLPDKAALEAAIIATGLEAAAEAFEAAVDGADEPLPALAAAYRGFALAHPTSTAS